MSAAKEYACSMLRALLLAQLLPTIGSQIAAGQLTSTQTGSLANINPNATGSQQEVNGLLSSVMLSNLRLISLLLGEKKPVADPGTAVKLETTADSTTSSVTRAVSCPSNFTYLPSVNGCYKPILESLAWPVAAIRCNSLHEKSHLVHINSESERLAVAQIMASQDIAACASKPAHGVAWWTGGRQIDQWTREFSWKYSPNDGAKQTDAEMRYKRWWSGQPDFYYGYPQCICASASRNQFEWDDFPCSDAFCSVCEIDL